MAPKIVHRTGRSVIFLPRQGNGLKWLLAFAFGAIGTGLFLVMLSAGQKMELSLTDIVAAVFGRSGGDTTGLIILLVTSLVFWLGTLLLLVSLWLRWRGVNRPTAFVFDLETHRFVVAEQGEDPFSNRFEVSRHAGYAFSQIHELGIREYTTKSSSRTGGGTTAGHYVACLFKKDGSFCDLYHSYQQSDAMAVLADLQAHIDLTQADAAEVSASWQASGPVTRWVAGRNLLYAWHSPARLGVVLAAILILGLLVLMFWQVQGSQAVVFRIVAGLVLGIVTLLLLMAMRAGVISLFNVHALRLTDEKVEMGSIPKSCLPNSSHQPKLADPGQADKKFRARKSLPVKEVARVQLNYSSGARPPFALVLAGRAAVAAMAAASDQNHLDFAGLIDAAKVGIKDSLTIHLPGLRLSDLIRLEAMLEADIRDRGGKVL